MAVSFSLGPVVLLKQHNKECQLLTAAAPSNVEIGYLHELLGNKESAIGVHTS